MLTFNSGITALTPDKRDNRKLAHRDFIYEPLLDSLEAFRAQGFAEYRRLDHIVQAEIGLALLFLGQTKSFANLQYLYHPWGPSALDGMHLARPTCPERGSLAA